MTVTAEDTQVERCSSLVALAASLHQTSKSAPNISTEDFVACCDKILPFFDHLGPVFFVARSEFQGKLDTIKQQVPTTPSLKDVVAADKAANTATGVVRAGMMTLPSREHFLASIGETEETALPRAEEVVAACVAVHNSVMQLFDGIDMPASNVWFWPGSK